MLKPTPAERPIIDPILKRFDDKLPNLNHFHGAALNAIKASVDLAPLIHSIRERIKDRDHLQDKLVRKIRECKTKNTPFLITKENLHAKVNDLAGIRLLHLHTMQAKEIHQHLHALLKGCGYKFVEGPEARTWDIEYEQTFRNLGFKTKRSISMYTSVHYVVSDQVPGLKMTCEIQVRTLAEEIWGEVDHTLNYPHPVDSVACREQLRALARATSTAGRMADAIFATYADEQSRKPKSKKKKSYKRKSVKKNLKKKKANK